MKPKVWTDLPLHPLPRPPAAREGEGLTGPSVRWVAVVFLAIGSYAAQAKAPDGPSVENRRATDRKGHIDSPYSESPSLLTPPAIDRSGKSTATATAEVRTGLKLSGLISTALATNPDLRLAAARIDVADAMLARARAEFYPKLSVSEAFVTTNIGGLAFFFEANQRRLSLNQDFNHPGFVSNFSTLATVQQNLYVGGRRTAESLAAHEERIAAAFSRATARNELVFRIAEAYFRLLQARELLESREAAVMQGDRHLELVRPRYENGTAVRSDVLSVEVQQAESREGLITATSQLELAWAILENVIGCRLPRELSPQPEPAPWASRVLEMGSALAEAFGQRPEVGAMAANSRSAAHQVDAARSGKRANVDFIGNFSTFDINPSSGGNGAFVGVIASINLFDGRRTRSQVERASAQVRELHAQHQRLLMDIELQVRQSYLALRSAEERLKVAEQAVSQANQSVREIENRYEDQKATITQLIDAQVAVTNARVRKASASADLEIARVGLERVAGRLQQFLGN